MLLQIQKIMSIFHPCRYFVLILVWKQWRFRLVGLPSRRRARDSGGYTIVVYWSESLKTRILQPEEINTRETGWQSRILYNSCRWNRANQIWMTGIWFNAWVTAWKWIILIYLRTCIQISNRTTRFLSHADVSPTVEIVYPWLGKRMSKRIEPCLEPWPCMGLARRTPKRVVAERAWLWRWLLVYERDGWERKFAADHLRNNIDSHTADNPHE
jgi:hypothetical protein